VLKQAIFVWEIISKIRYVHGLHYSAFVLLESM